MPVYSKISLSGSINDLPIPVAATTSPGTTIHVADAGGTVVDSIFFTATNITANPVQLTIQWGGTTDPTNDMIYKTWIPPNSLPIMIAAGHIIRNGLTISAWASVANAINIVGWVDKIQ
jgi:hypothetical protein